MFVEKLLLKVYAMMQRRMGRHCRDPAPPLVGINSLDDVNKSSSMTIPILNNLQTPVFANCLVYLHFLGTYIVIFNRMSLATPHTHIHTEINQVKVPHHGLRLAGSSEQLGEVAEMQFWRSKLR